MAQSLPDPGDNTKPALWLNSITHTGNKPSHALTSTSTTGGSTASTSYGYDAAGDMATRTTPTFGSQNLSWNDAGQLTAITGGTNGDSHYLYNVDGSLLLQKDPGTCGARKVIAAAEVSATIDQTQMRSSPDPGSMVTPPRRPRLVAGGGFFMAHLSDLATNLAHYYAPSPTS